MNILDLEMEHRPFEEVFNENLIALNHDLVGISEHSEGLRIAQLAKDRGAVTVLGRYHPTGIPEELLSQPQVDLVVSVAKVSSTMRELVEKGGLQDVSYRDKDQVVHNPDREFIEDLDGLPFPARHLRRYSSQLNEPLLIDTISKFTDLIIEGVKIV